ncbi:hypothetical protein, partial [Bradyrhizobium liaoningense]|uniref:hypothetical protein n=1 Tax=Bradyrhizobium liaoningense TaxID=43992 RepID=UPI001BAC464F
ESYAASALYTTLASLSGALSRIRRARKGSISPAAAKAWVDTPKWAENRIGFWMRAMWLNVTRVQIER